MNKIGEGLSLKIDSKGILLQKRHSFEEIFFPVLIGLLSFFISAFLPVLVSVLIVLINLNYYLVIEFDSAKSVFLKYNRIAGFKIIQNKLDRIKTSDIQIGYRKVANKDEFDCSYSIYFVDQGDLNYLFGLESKATVDKLLLYLDTYKVRYCQV